MYQYIIDFILRLDGSNFIEMFDNEKLIHFCNLYNETFVKNLPKVFVI